MLMATAKKKLATKRVVPAQASVDAVKSNKVEIHPNRMTWAISAFGGAILVLLAVIAVTNQL